MTTATPVEQIAALRADLAAAEREWIVSMHSVIRRLSCGRRPSSSTSCCTCEPRLREWSAT
jgi:hypothetical protein